MQDKQVQKAVEDIMEHGIEGTKELARKTKEVCKEVKEEIELSKEQKNIVEEIVKEVKEEKLFDSRAIMKEYYESETPEQHKLTNVGKLNEAIGGGFNAGSLSVVVARSGFGKTNFLVEVAHNFAKQGLKVAFVSCEMTPNKMAERLLSRDSGIPYNKIRNEMEAKNESIKKAIRNIANNFNIDFMFSQKIEDIWLEAGSLPEEKGTNILIIDHIHEITTDKAGNNLAQFIHILDKLEDLYKGTGMTVIVAAQFNSNSDKGNDNGRRNSDDIMGSSMLRNKASNIIHLFESEDQEEYNKGLGSNTKDMQCTLRLMKARDGWGGWETSVDYDKACCKFTIRK